MSKDRLVHFGAAAILALTGCSSTVEIQQTNTPVIEPQIRSEVDLYYPELGSLPLYSSGELHTQETTTKWLNFTKRNFNPSIAQATFAYFEKLAKSQRIIEYMVGDQSIPFFLGQRSKTQRVFFIIPENTLLPIWDNKGYPEAATTYKFQTGPNVSFAKVHNSIDSIPPSKAFTSVETAFSRSFNIEACQSSIDVASVSSDDALLGQEIICNSYGAAFTIKQGGIPFSEYQQWAKVVQIRKDPQSPYYLLYVLSKDEYAEIPVVGWIIR